MSHGVNGRFTAREHDGRKEVHLKDMIPHVDRGVDQRQPLAALRLGRDCRVVDERVELASVQASLDLDNGCARPLGIGEINLDVVLRSHLPRAIFGKGVSRAGNHAPAGGRKALDGGMAYAAARPGQQERAALLVGMRRRHARKIPLI